MWIYQGKCSIKQNEEAYSTWYSQAVSHPSTNQAGPCLASEIRRDRAYSGWYGRKWMLPPTIPYLYMWIYQGKCSIKQNGEAYSTWYSQAVSHPSTNQAGPCLASEIRRDRAYWGWYGRKWMLPPTIPYLYMWIYQGKCSIKQNEEAYSKSPIQVLTRPDPVLAVSNASTHDTLFIHVNISGEVFNKTKWRSLQHLVFPGSLPSKY